jgi:predicted unusual protein kinase regulating ubiquinone biosynthesis (AarF/ABC1/UbiB family)
MIFSDLVRRGLGLIKVGKAIRDVRSSSDENKRERANHYLMETLGKGRGLPAKLGQFLTMDEGSQSLRSTLDESIPPLTYDEVIAVLEEVYKVPFSSIFKTLGKKGISASLGQVHFGELNDGREVAVKVQYPDIGNSVEAELKLLGLMPNMGPAKKWGFDIEGYRQTFLTNFTNELDYQREPGNQTRYRALVSAIDKVFVPEVIEEFCRPLVLVQEKLTGISLDEASSLSKQSKKAMGRQVLKQYLHMLFRHGMVHSDPNPANFAFREGEPPSLILYDFGSVLKISDKVRLSLLRTILALQDREAIEPAACLAGLGFDHDKLDDLRPSLPALVQTLFLPFTSDAPFDVKEWRISEKIESLVGDLKWWFRSAAPPELIFLMRTLHGMTVILGRLDAQLSWKFFLDQICSDLYDQARALKIDDLPGKKIGFPGFDRLSSFLKVHVEKADGKVVDLTMPSRVVDNLEDVIDQPVMESIERKNIDLEKIQTVVRQNGYVPQIVFELEDSERKVKVWLE